MQKPQNNTPQTETSAIVDRDREWALYDALPKRIRDALKYVSFDYSVESVAQEYMRLRRTRPDLSADRIIESMAHHMTKGCVRP